jgi:hypothetical protein
LDALSGFVLSTLLLAVSFTWVAKLQLPLFHFSEGSGQAVQYHPEGNFEVRSHPSHCSTMAWQVPPLKEQPFFVMNTHSVSGFTVVQSIGTTSFLVYDV